MCRIYIIAIIKVAIYQNMSENGSPEEFDVLNDLKRREYAGEIIFLVPYTLQIRIKETDISFNLIEIDIVKSKFNILFIRGGLGNIISAIELILSKNCDKSL